jgi:predicted nuclease with RNAse H fold
MESADLVADVTVAGIDVGGERKGFHIAILCGNKLVLSDKSRDPQYLAQLCLAYKAVAVGIDSPCQWGRPGVGRTAEKELAAERIFCFSTPTRERATNATSGFYGWMFNGERLYQALAATYPLLHEAQYSGGVRAVCFETFPHAVTCSMLGTNVASAKHKRQQRRQLLENAAIDTRSLKSIDAIDAALCALTATHLMQRNTKSYGDAEGGYIFVPKSPVAH